MHSLTPESKYEWATDDAVRTERAPRFFIFGFDMSEAAQIRRVKGLLSSGAYVSSAMMRRGNMNQDFVPDWPNLPLSQVDNERIGQRLLGIVGSLATILAHRKALEGCTVIMARNLDMLVIAWASRLLTGRWRTPLVYECLDIHRILTRGGVMGRVARWCERRLLKQCAALVVSSPGFMRNYFHPVQGYDGTTILLENKLWLEGSPVVRPIAPPTRMPDAPLRLGWVGSIRCAPSLDLLMGVADALGPEVRIVVSGNVHRHAVPKFDEEIARRDNVIYTGPYVYPSGLAEVYARCDAVWAQDLWQAGTNSDWLLPNRIYEASFFGCPSIAVAHTETGVRVARDGLGFTVAEPSVSEVVGLLRSQGADGLRKCSECLLALDETEFRLFPEDYVRSFAPVLAGASTGSPARAREGSELEGACS